MLNSILATITGIALTVYVCLSRREWFDIHYRLEVNPSLLR